MQRQSWISTCALALGFVFLVGLAVPADATCWFEYDCKRCRLWSGGGGEPTPQPIPSLHSFLQSLNGSEVQAAALVPSPSPQPCCTCCSPPGGPVNCDFILQPAAVTPETETSSEAEVAEARAQA